MGMDPVVAGLLLERHLAGERVHAQAEEDRMRDSRHKQDVRDMRGENRLLERQLAESRLKDFARLLGRGN